MQQIKVSNRPTPYRTAGTFDPGRELQLLNPNGKFSKMPKPTPTFPKFTTFAEDQFINPDNSNIRLAYSLKVTWWKSVPLELEAGATEKDIEIAKRTATEILLKQFNEDFRC